MAYRDLLKFGVGAGTQLIVECALVPLARGRSGLVEISRSLEW